MHHLSFDSKNRCVYESAGQFISINHPLHPHRCLHSAVLLLGYSGIYPIAQDGREYLLEQGSFLFLFPEHEHYGTAPASHGQSHFWCHIQLPEGWMVTESALSTSHCVLPEFGRLSHAEKYFILFNQLIDASNRNSHSPALRQSICDAYASILLNSISDEYCTALHSAADAHSQSRAVLSEKVLQWIRIHFREPITTQTVASALQYNSDYLTHVLKSTTGYTLSETIQAIRLKEAEKLLLNSDMRIAEIAFAVGFQDEKYFMKAFKKTENVTPSEYRQAHFRMHINQK